MIKRTVIAAIISILALCELAAQPLPRVTPRKAGMDPVRLARVDAVIERSIEAEDIPGAVLAVVRGGRMAYLKAYGNRRVYPDTVAMTTNTVFDLASLSKPLSTAISVMILLERGELRLRDRVDLYIPGFQPWTDSLSGRRRDIRIVDLMTHTSGLPPYAPVEELEKIYTVPNPDGLIEWISNVKRNNEPTTVFDYSCLNFITLQRIIETVSGESLQAFARQNIFSPLGLNHTDYNPQGEMLDLVAPTERQEDGTVLRGRVHDPLARVMNDGVSGNAGLFSDAEDLAVLAAMVLGEGEIGGVRILAPLTVRAMRSVPKGFERFGRSPGWDIFSAYASDGDLFDPSAFGHTGYTGTSITIDHDTDTAVILLAHRVHPVDKGSVVRLRELVANVVAGSIVTSLSSHTP